jgi:hypothetical protein
MAQQKKDSIIINNPGSNQSKGILGRLKWYWWVLIIIVAFFFISSLASSLFGSNGGGSSLGKNLSDVLNALLGLPLALLSALSKSPFAYFMVFIWAAPLIGTGMSSIYKAYREHAGPDKSEAEKQKDAGVSPEQIEDSWSKIKKANPGISEENLRNAVTNDGLNKIYNEVRAQQEALVKNGSITAEQANKTMQQYNRDNPEKPDGDADGVTERDTSDIPEPAK